MLRPSVKEVLLDLRRKDGGQLGVSVEPLQSSEEQIEFLRFVVSVVKSSNLLYHRVYVVHHKGSYHHAKEHHERITEPLWIASWVVVAEPNCREAGEDEVRQSNNNFEPGLLVELELCDKVIISLIQIFVRSPWTLPRHASSPQIAHNVPQYPWEVADAQDDSDQGQSPEHLGDEHDGWELGVVLLLREGLLPRLADYQGDPLILESFKLVC